MHTFSKDLVLSRPMMLLVGLLVVLPAGCRSSGGAKRKSGGSSQTDGDHSSGSGNGPVSVDFLAFGQTADAKQRTVRFRVKNDSTRPVVSVKVRFEYSGKAGEPLGAFPLEIARAKSDPLAAGAQTLESFDLMGQDGPPEQVSGIRIQLERVTFGDGSTWTAPGRASP
jgi:hypothetical protein